MTNTDKGRLTLIAVAFASAGALALALVSQHVFGLLPCDLCYLQRVPHALIFVFGALGAISAVPPREKRIVLMHCGLLFILSAGFAGYHVGVEELWWAGPVSCSGGGGALTMDGLAAALTQSARPSCEEAAVRVLGISMAGYNFIASVGLTAFCFWAMRQRTWWGQL